MKIQWEKIFAQHIPNKGLVLGKNKEHLKLNKKKWAKDLTNIFVKEAVQTTKKANEKMFSITRHQRNAN